MNEFRSRILGGDDGNSPLLPAKSPSGAKADSGLRTIAVTRLETRTSDTRADDRHRLPDRMVGTTYRGQSHDVQMINLSDGGAMISGAFEPMLWDRVDLHLQEGSTIECVVQWVRDDRIGLEFAPETRIDCSPAERNSLLREVIARSFPDAAVERADVAPAEAAIVVEPELPEEHPRGEARHPLVWSGVVHFNHSTTPVRLRNISSNGALIECQDGLPEGAELLLDLGDTGSLFATASWVVGDQVGLTFQQPFDIKLLALSKPDVATSNWEAPDYLKGKSPPSADPWGRLSVSELSSELEGFLKR